MNAPETPPRLSGSGLALKTRQNRARKAGIAMTVQARPPQMVVCPRCDARWGGLKTAHCTGCHTTFTTVSAFDKHRTGSHSADTRTCLPPADVGLVDAGRAYPCWGFPAREESEDEDAA